MAIARNLLLSFAFLATCYLGSHLKGAKSQKPKANGRKDGLLAIALGVPAVVQQKLSTD